MELQVAIGVLAERFGIAPWQVGWGLFVEDFDPLDPDGPGPAFQLDVWGLQGRLIVSGLPQKVLDEIVEFAYDVDLVIQVEVSDAPRSESPALSECKLAMQIPLEAPPDLAVEETLFALRSARRLL